MTVEATGTMLTCYTDEGWLAFTDAIKMSEFFLRTAIIEILEKRFGEVSEKAKERLRNTNGLMRLRELIIKASTVEELRLFEKEWEVLPHCQICGWKFPYLHPGGFCTSCSVKFLGKDFMAIKELKKLLEA